MIDVKLDASGDLDVSGNDLHFIAGADQVAQRCRIRLRTFRGEVALNLDAGVPWFEEILGVKPTDLDRVEAIIREAILQDAEITEIQTFSVDYNATQRLYTVAFSAKTVTGFIEDNITFSESL